VLKRVTVWLRWTQSDCVMYTEYWHTAAMTAAVLNSRRRPRVLPECFRKVCIRSVQLITSVLVERYSPVQMSQ